MIGRIWKWIREAWELGAKQDRCSHVLTLENHFICPHCDFDLMDR